MISHNQFGSLRLAQFRPDAGIAELDGWEFMDAVWIGEAIGFSEWLRLESDPENLASLAVDFSEFPPADAASVLDAIDLPVRPGMSAHELESLLGEPVEVQRFIADRVTYEFEVGAPRYRVACTVLVDGGLSYIVVMRK